MPEVFRYEPSRLSLPGAELATVRIYKVAELLGLTSQEAMGLLKQETGIDVKSASSSIEEIVARQFVERQARKRRIALPPGPLFNDAPVAKKPGKSAPEPPPMMPALRPRLVKTIKPVAPGEAEMPVPAELVMVPEVPVVEMEPPPVREPERLPQEPLVEIEEVAASEPEAVA